MREGGHIAGTHQPQLRRARRWIGIMLVAWTLVTGAIVSVGAAYSARSNDIRILIAALTGPLLMGIVILVALGTVRLIERARARHVDAAGHMERQFSRHVFGRRRS